MKMNDMKNFAMQNTATKTVMQKIIALIGAVMIALLSSQTHAAETRITYYLPDAQGSPIAAFDATGKILWRQHYQPFGQEIEQDAASKDKTIGYTGHVHNRETGLTYMGRRYYDPAIGRFMSMDPAGVNPNDPRTFNRYAYANNNPYRYVDPDGKWAVPLALWIVAETVNLTIEAHTAPPENCGNDCVVSSGFGTPGPIGARAGTVTAKILARESEQVAKFADEAKLIDHFMRHGADFGAKSAAAYAKQADSFLTGSVSKDVLQKVRANGDVVRFNQSTNEFGVLSSNGSIKTYFKPEPSVHGKGTNLDYFNAQ